MSCGCCDGLVVKHSLRLSFGLHSPQTLALLRGGYGIFKRRSLAGRSIQLGVGIWSFYSATQPLDPTSLSASWWLWFGEHLPQALRTMDSSMMDCNPPETMVPHLPSLPVYVVCISYRNADIIHTIILPKKNKFIKPEHSEQPCYLRTDTEENSTCGKYVWAADKH